MGIGGLVVDNTVNAPLGASLSLNNLQTLTVLGGLTINNTGAITMNGGALDGIGAFSNSGMLTGKGAIAFSGTAVNNQGATIHITGSKPQFTGPGGLDNQGIYITDPSTSIFSALTDETTGYQVGSAGDSYQIFGDFINNSQQNLLWDTSQVDVEFSGGINHNLAWPGVDNGPTYGAYTYNYAIGTLELDQGDTLTLQPANSAPSGALYLSDVQLDGAPAFDPNNPDDPTYLFNLRAFISADVKNLSAGTPLNVYYDAYSSGDAYLDDQTYALGNGGDLIPAPEPSCVALAGAGAGLLLRQRRRR
jgi:hypothetical protein